MTTTTSSRPSSLRAFVVAVGLLLASLFASGTVSASTLIPMVDMGSPGGGGGSATVVDETVARGPLSAF